MTQLIKVQENGITTVDPFNAITNENLADAFRALVPNGKNMDTAKLKAAALAMKATNRNLFAREGYVTELGWMESARARASDARELLASQGDCIEKWLYETDPKRFLDPDIIARDSIDLTKDIIIEVRPQIESLRKKWMADRAEMRASGEDVETINAVLGKQPYPYAYGIVRFAEQTDDAGKTNGKTAVQKWAEMDNKYSRTERAKKRGRDLVHAAMFHVSTDQRQAIAAQRAVGIMNALANGDHIHHDGHISPALKLSPTQRAAMRPSDDDSLIIESTATEAPPPRPQATSAPDEVVDITDEYSQPESDEPAQPEGEPIIEQQAAPKLPDSVAAIVNPIKEKAAFYESKGWALSDKQNNLFNIFFASKLVGKNEDNIKTLKLALFGCEHLADANPAMKKAVWTEFIKPEADPKTNYLVPCETAQRAACAIVKAMKP